MRIYFCDKCNESIPLKDMQTSRVTIAENKIYCSKCAPRPSKFKSAFRTGYRVLLPALLCVGVGMVVFAMWGDKILSAEPKEDFGGKIDKLEQRLSERMKDLDSRVGMAESDLKETTPAGDELSKLSRIHRALNEQVNAIKELRHSLNTLKDEIQGRTDQQYAQVDARLAKLEEADGKASSSIDALLVDIEKNRVELQNQKKRVEEVATTAAAIGARAAAAPPVVAPTPAADNPSAAPVKPADPSEKPLSAVDERKLQDSIKKLGDKDDSRRFAAVFEIFDIKGRRAEEALVKAMDDRVDYIQQSAIGCLADLSAQWTIPIIIPKLKSENTFIRDAAISALEKLTGQKLDVKAESGATKLAAKAKELEKWWADNKAKIAGAK